MSVLSENLCVCVCVCLCVLARDDGEEKMEVSVCVCAVLSITCALCGSHTAHLGQLSGLIDLFK